MVTFRLFPLAVCLTSTFALPGFTFPDLGLPTTVTTPDGNTLAGTAPIETSSAAITTGESPVYTANTVTKTHAHAEPQTAIEEKTATQLNLPTTTNVGAAPTTPVQAQITATPQSNHDTIIYNPPAGATTAGLIVPGAPAVTQALPSTIPAGVAGALYSVTIAATPSAILQTSQSGATGLTAGSAVTLAGTTYSVAPGGSAIYMNGVSSALTGSAWLQTGAPVSTSHSNIILSNGTPVLTASASMVVRGGTSIKSGPSSTSTIRTSTSAQSSAPSSTLGTTNAGINLMPSIWALGITMSLTWLVIL